MRSKTNKSAQLQGSGPWLTLARFITTQRDLATITCHLLSVNCHHQELEIRLAAQTKFWTRSHLLRLEFQLSRPEFTRATCKLSIRPTRPMRHPLEAMTQWIPDTQTLKIKLSWAWSEHPNGVLINKDNLSTLSRKSSSEVWQKVKALTYTHLPKKSQTSRKWH